MNTETIQKLEADIEKIKRELKSKQMMLSLIKQQEKKPFIETKIGKGYMKLLRSVTKPFVSLNHIADQAVERPHTYTAEQKLLEARSLIKKCEVTQPTDKKVKSILIDACELKAEMDNYQDEIGIPEAQAILAAHIARLRPSRSPESQAELDAVVKDAVEQVASSMSSGIEDQPF